MARCVFAAYLVLMLVAQGGKTTRRHTYGSWLAQSGHPLTVIRDLMGHSPLAMTSRYSHLAPDHLRAAVASLPGWERAGKKSAGRTARKAA